MIFALFSVIQVKSVRKSESHSVECCCFYFSICGVCAMKIEESAPGMLLNLFQNCDFPEELSKAFHARFNLRKTYTFCTEDTVNSGNRKRKTADNGPTASKQKLVAGKKKFPHARCSTITERLPQHLQKVHKLTRNDPRYKKAMHAALVVSNEEDTFGRREEQLQREMSSNCWERCA